MCNPLKAIVDQMVFTGSREPDAGSFHRHRDDRDEYRTHKSAGDMTGAGSAAAYRGLADLRSKVAK